MIPRATYRLQFNRGFTFYDAAALAPYLAALGVSHLYASPWLKARAGSTHGYDIVDYHAFNPELGGEDGFERLNRALTQAGLRQIVDFVPNHMGVVQAENAWWTDVLTWGRASPYAEYFDIEWAPSEPRLHHKVLLPVLGRPYGEALEAGELTLQFDSSRGTLDVCYHEHRFPLAARSYPRVIRAAVGQADDAAPLLQGLAADFGRLRTNTPAGVRRARTAFERLAARLAGDASVHAAMRRGAAQFSGVPGEPGSFRAMHRLLERQHYRLAYWRTASEEINYRRFFDISALAAIRMERRDVFDDVHALVHRLLEEGKLDGLRIDHVDGLYDPARYCRRLRRLAPGRAYLVVEKILSRGEALRPDWPVQGTTGYDFMNQVNGLLVNGASEAAMTRACRQFTGARADFDEVVYASKKQIIDTSFGSELGALSRRLHRIAGRHWRARDYTLRDLTRALVEIAASFPVYRTYVDGRPAAAPDLHYIEQAVAAAQRRWPGEAKAMFEFIGSVLAGAPPTSRGVAGPHVEATRLALKFQQFTSVVMAKGFEDTALYRYHRLDALNDVGGDPRQFGTTAADFHAANVTRAQHWPHGMLATATHDTKRGEDVRARLAALTEIPWAWARAVRRWAILNRSAKRDVGGVLAPESNDEYLLYQTLIGAWPVELSEEAWDQTVADTFTRRVQAYMTKALREAKQRSSWTDPAIGYEQATSDFVAAILNGEQQDGFLASFLPLQERVAELGVHNSLVQLVLKLTSPGVPDIYQGGELWDLHLVDPDNRRSVDFETRRRMLARIRALDPLGPQERAEAVTNLRKHWRDGAIKMYVLYRLLQLRAKQPDLFEQGGYTALDVGPVDVPEDARDSVIAFARSAGGQCIVVAASLRAGLAVAGRRARIRIGDDADAAFTDVLSGQSFRDRHVFRGARLFQHLPVAVLSTG
ncbi:MAG TPA: malto-oligosyltrehalose synthase [Rhodanobacteraceae bacterium]|nr:malto-oligosyltrehalose synthase [Rhodanobacteraceae bacterium]